MSLDRTKVLEMLNRIMDAHCYGELTVAFLEKCAQEVKAMDDVPFHMQDRTRCLVVGAQNQVISRHADAHDAAEQARRLPGHMHAKAYVSLADAPVKELEGTVPVVLYFGNRSDAEEFLLLVQQAKPGLVARQL